MQKRSTSKLNAMENKIVEILKKNMFNTSDEAGNVYNVVEEDDFKEIAEEIKKLFTTPVIESVCDIQFGYCEHWHNQKYGCKGCIEIFKKQTVV